MDSNSNVVAESNSLLHPVTISQRVIVQKNIFSKNIKLINEWVKENPGCQDPRTKQNVKYNKIVMNSMSGGTIEEQQDNIEKIVKNVVKAVTIDKHCLK
mgnify:CR=1 FL=1